MRKIINTPKSPAAIGTYSQGVVANGFAFTSGQIPLDPETGSLVEGDFARQVEQVIRNLSAVLEAGGSSLGQILKLTVYLKDLGNFPLLNEVFKQYFRDNPPARSTVEVSDLPMGVEVEIDAVGLVK